MDMQSVFRMNAGTGEYSYATNSSLQENVIRKSLPVINKTIKAMVDVDNIPRRFHMADLACSSGPNTLFVISNIINMVYELCKEINHKEPQFQVSLNDLFENDFNAIFKSLPIFYAKLKKEKGENFGPCFISGVPGSFYERLFPDESLHFVHSSYGIHWLSQVPEGLENNEKNIYMSKTSPPNVFEAYKKQFEKDFMTFLHLRSQEMVRGGRMVLSYQGRSIIDPTSEDCCAGWELMTKSLLDMVKEGLIEEAEINSFNLPYYTPHEDEVKNVIKSEGSFSLDDFQVFHVDWVPYDNDRNAKGLSNSIQGKNAAKKMRAVIEPLLTYHFKNSIVDRVFKKFEIYAIDYIQLKKPRFFNAVISLTKL